MKIVCLTLMLSCLSAVASAGSSEEMNRQRLLICHQLQIEEEGARVIPQWIAGTVGAARSATDCTRISG